MTNFHEEMLAVPYRVEFTVPYAEMRAKFDEYWEKRADFLIKAYNPKLKKGKGGSVPKDKARKMIEANIPVLELYGSVVSGLLSDELKAAGRDLFYIDGLNLYDFEEGKEPIVLGRVYYWPEMRLKPEAELKFEAKFPFKIDFEKAWGGKRTELWHKNRKVSDTELDSGPIHENYDLLMDIIASCDGQPYEKGTRRGTWFEVRTLNEEMRGACLAHNVGDLFEVDFVMAKMDPEIEGKTVHATIKIFKAREVVYREVDDALAVESGFKDLADMQADFQRQYEEHVQNTKRGVAADAVISAVLSQAEVPAIPDCWMLTATDRLISNHLARFGGNRDKAKAAVRAQNEEHFKQLFQSEVMRDMLHQLALRLYRKLYDLVDATTESLYDDMVNRCHWGEENG
jgi:FKBP-type peptidyl-prolyl cis-trans isomerase (trigger factor)